AGGATGAVYRVLERIVARSADSVLCVSPDLEERMRAAGARRVGRAVVPAAIPALDASAAGVSAETSPARPLPGDPAPDRPGLPGTWEGRPLSLQEALRAGVPIVATRVGGTPLLTGEDAALLVPPGDARRLADAVRAVLTDEVLAARLRKAASARRHALPGEDRSEERRVGQVSERWLWCSQTDR